MSKVVSFLLRAVAALACTLIFTGRLSAAPVFVPVAGLPLPASKPEGVALVSDGAGNFWGTTNQGGLYGVGTVFKINESTGAITTVVDFAKSTTSSNRGTYPWAGLVSDGVGNFWGTTESGGAGRSGTVFKVNISSGVITTVADFADATTGGNRGAYPMAALVKDSAGNLWGTTSSGGLHHEGTVFKINGSTGTITTVVDFSNSTTGANRGGEPTAALVSDGAGYFWGTTPYGGASSMGTVFKVNASTGAITTVVDFEGAEASGENRGKTPMAAPVSDGAGNLWGTTEYGGVYDLGTVFKVNASTGVITTVLDLGDPTNGDPENRASNPVAGLVSDGAGNFWGTTLGGSLYSGGTVFKVNESTGAITTVVDFDGTPLGNNSGALPQAELVSDGAGNFWGTTTSGGGSAYFGTVFKVNASTGAMTTVAAMAIPPFGLYPSGGLVSDGAGNLWGTAAEGGTSDEGTVFKVSESTGTITTVVNFAGSETGDNRGSSPSPGLVSDGAGNFWGTTLGGGTGAAGTIFKVDASTGAITTVVDFNFSTTGDNRGGNPQAALVSDGAGNFWGTTTDSGANECGTVFKVNASTGAITTVADFTSDASFASFNQNANAPLVSDGAGNFWGTTYDDGLNGGGTVFKINEITGVITTVISFANSTTGANRGATPYGGLASDGTGNFWGTTESGGANGQGTVFKINASTGVISTLVDFANTTTGGNRGGGPSGAIVSDGAGNFWGTTSYGGANGYGTVFEVNVSTGTITTVFDFTGFSGSVPGSSPRGSLLLTPAGFYGTSDIGGPGGGAGGIFLIDFGPQIAAVSSGSVTMSGATISGTVNPEGIATSVYVQYGTTTAYGSQTDSVALGSGTTPAPFSLALSGLSSGKTYDYQVVFVTPNGNFYSANQTFTTTGSSGGHSNANLSALVPSAGKLSPVFNTSVTSYSLSVPSATSSITFKPTVADSTATVQVNGTPVASGTASGAIGLAAGPNTITVLVTAQDGVTTDTYTITVTRLVPPAITTLAAGNLTTTGATLNGVAVANNESTTVSFDYGTSTTYGSNVAATPNTATGTASTPVSAQLSGLNPGTVYHYRAKGISAAGTTNGADMTFTTISTVDTLSALKTSVGTLSPAFASGKLSYTTTVSGNTTSLTVTPTVTKGSNATVAVNGAAVTSGGASAPVLLSVGINPITIVVTAQDGGTTQTYNLNVIVPTVPTATTLAAATVTATTATLNGTINAQGASTKPSFNYGTTAAYGKSAAATPATVTGLTTANVSARITGLLPATTYHFQAKGVSTAGTGTGGDVTFTTPNNVATLSGLALSSGTLSPAFTSTGVTYKATVSNDTASVTLTPTLSDSNATVTVNGTAAASGNPSAITLNVGANPIHVIVTAQDGATTKTYTVTVTRTAVAPTMTTLAADNIGTTTATLNGAAVANYSTANLSFDYGTATSYGKNIAASPGTATDVTSTSISASLTGLKPGTKYYFRAKGVNLGGTGDGTQMSFTTISNVATLASLKLSTGTLAPAFGATTTAYNVTVPDAVTSLTVTPTVTSGSNATVTVAGNVVVSGGVSGTIALSYGVNPIPVVVTAQDGVTTRTYTVNVTRLTAPTVTPLAATALTATTATLNGTVNANDTSTKASFNYGLTSAYGKTAAATPATITGSNSTAVLAKLTGLTPNTQYHFQVKGVSTGGTSLSGDFTFNTPNNVATLSGLALSSGTLSPVFASTSITYSATVANSSSSITVTPTLSDPNATVKVGGMGVTSGTASGPINLNAGANSILVVVTAQDRLTIKTYTIKVTRSVASEKPAKQEKPASTLASTKTSDSAPENTTTAANSSSDSTTDGGTTPATPTTPAPIKAQLTGPVQNGGVLTGVAASFTWNAGRGVSNYWLSVGSDVGGKDIYDGEQGQALSRTVTVPTDGADVYVTLRSLIDGVWKSNNYVFTAADTTKAVLTAPADGSVAGVDSTGATVFTWNTLPAASGYWLQIGSVEGGSDLYDASVGITNQSVVLPADGRELFITLLTNVNGQWLSSTSTLIAASPAPADSATTPAPAPTTSAADAPSPETGTAPVASDSAVASAPASLTSSPSAIDPVPGVPAQLTAPAADHPSSRAVR